MKKIRWKIAQWFERRWWKNYLQSKSPEEYLDWKMNYWLDFIAKLDFSVDDFKKNMIDVGCGPAGIFMIFPKNEVTALDPLLENYSQLAVFSENNYPNVDFVNQSFEAYKSEVKFQTVFCLNAINHFIDLKASFKKLFNITEDGGQVVISIDAHNHGFFRFLFAALPLDILHPHQYNLEEYIVFLERSGFKLEKKLQVKKAFFFDYWVLVARK